MEFELFAAGYSVDNGLPTQRAACAAVLLARRGGLVKYREITHHLESATAPQAELQAAYLALMAVRPKFRNMPTTLWVGSYPARVLGRDGDRWTVVPRTNERLVARLRELSLEFPGLRVNGGRASGLARAGDLVRQAAQAQTQSDSGSLDEAPVEQSYETK